MTLPKLRIMVSIMVLVCCAWTLPATAEDGPNVWASWWQRVIAYFAGIDAPAEDPPNDDEIVHGVPVGG
jgi:hypothetical protein